MARLGYRAKAVAAPRNTQRKVDRAHMARDLVIVESPTKARTIERILGSQYVVRASMGHVRDLPRFLRRGDIGVKINGSFRPEYVIPEDKRPVINELTKLAKDADIVYLATDPDREGEAISWHLAQALQLQSDRTRRVVSHEITPEGIRAAFQSPREIDMDLVNAQQARRVLDRVVGYKLSPLITKKLMCQGLSAGRVQTPALRMVVEREREIEAFVPVESWSIEARLAKHGNGRSGAAAAFTAELFAPEGQKRQMSIAEGGEARAIVQDLEGAAYAVSAVTRRQVRQRPSPPFITSTLQQEAGTKLRFTATRTMQVAQQLYEGVALGGGESAGLITYMRTDSTNLAQSALQEVREHIGKAYGKEYLPAQARVYKTKVKGAQEAHEAIRPTSSLRTPEQIRRFLTPEQYRLYDLVWKRFVACQMADALLNRTSVDIAARSVRSGNGYVFRATGTTLTFPGFRVLYQESSDTPDSQVNERTLPELAKDESLLCRGLEPKQHFTQPPPRYTEASLIRALEEKGIGRPSTYAAIVSTIQRRDYVMRDRGVLRPLIVGSVVNNVLTEHFSRVMDLGFTAKMEEELDDIARGEQDWQEVLRAFYDPFALDLEQAQERIPRRGIETGDVCEACGRPMILKRSKIGRMFLSCSGYPDCKSARPLANPGSGVTCPQCAEGELRERRATKGRRRSTFYGCSRYPQCDYTTNQKPLPEPCPDCGRMLVRAGRGRAKCTSCEFKGPVPEQATEQETEKELVEV